MMVRTIFQRNDVAPMVYTTVSPFLSKEEVET